MFMKGYTMDLYKFISELKTIQRTDIDNHQKHLIAQTRSIRILHSTSNKEDDINVNGFIRQARQEDYKSFVSTTFPELRQKNSRPLLATVGRLDLFET
jgi:hypothetical protein